MSEKDLISRQQAIHAFDDAGFCTHDYVVGTLKDLPSAQPVRKKGVWLVKNFPICIGAKELFEVYICSNCGYVVEGNNVSNFCPVCGSDMRGNDE